MARAPGFVCAILDYFYYYVSPVSSDTIRRLYDETGCFFGNMLALEVAIKAADMLAEDVDGENARTVIETVRGLSVRIPELDELIEVYEAVGTVDADAVSAIDPEVWERVKERLNLLRTLIANEAVNTVLY